MFEAQQNLRTDPRFDELWTLVRSRALLSQRLAELDHQVRIYSSLAALQEL